ncbi:abortive phage resistance protein [Lichenibacterium minor]|uniref:Abortive phage resistance protein n=1 Tax=Lichenibacterium minor TaxID=2316528 RepID=A0A4Q2U6N3_9HYPH|nr:abortive infection family protein [Lichenibacterium minor]RYC32010.1 abortive phage resistance protein [Lichenibacterium minor]
MDDMPETRIDQVTMIEGILTAAATGGSDDGPMYEALRRELLADDRLKPLLPSFVRTNRSLGAFWPFIKGRSGKWAERRQIISEAFTPLVDYLEGRGRAPSDDMTSDALVTFDPEGAITVARTLLETVCKRILNELGLPHAEKDDLPKLYGAVAKALRLAPDQHVEEPIKAILGGAMNLVNGIGTLRNRFSDAHAPGAKMPVKPSERHAKLAVNTAGAVASFLVETYLDRAEAMGGVKARTG